MKKSISHLGVLASLGFWILLVVVLLLRDGGPVAFSNEKGVAIASIASDSPAHPITSSSTAVPVVAADQPAEALYKEIKGRLRAGEGLEDSFKRLHVPTPVRHELITNLASALDLRHLRPDDYYSILLDESEDLHECTYQSDSLNIYQVKKTATGYVTEKLSIPLEVKTVRISGLITSSLFSAFIEQGEAPKLIHAFATIFASKLDFNTESREGDRFSLVFEKYYKDGEFAGYGRILVARYEQADRVLEGYWYSSGQSPAGHYNKKGEELGTSFLRSPIPFGRVSSRFSYRRRHPILNVVRPHLGVDLAAPTGTPVMAASDGRVISIGWRGGFGKTIVLKHANGYKTHYGHLSAYKKGLKVGSRVDKKDIIGYVGATGLATGPHLDYRISCNGVFKNPFSIEFKPNSVLAGAELEHFNTVRKELARYMDPADDRKILQVKNVVLDPDSDIFFL